MIAPIFLLIKVLQQLKYLRLTGSVCSHNLTSPKKLLWDSAVYCRPSNDDMVHHKCMEFAATKCSEDHQLRWLYTEIRHVCGGEICQQLLSQDSETNLHVQRPNDTGYQNHDWNFKVVMDDNLD